MKLKYDFITNSSSSSFIISNKKPNEGLGTIKVTMEIDLEQFLESISEYTKFTKVKDILDYYNGYSGEFDMMKDIIDNKGEILIVELESNSNNPIERYILKEGLKCVKFKNKSIKIIQDVGGY